MISFNYNKKQAYIYAYEIIPKKKEIDFIKKIFLLEQLFSLNVDSIHYHLNKKDVTVRQYWSKETKNDNPLITFCSNESNHKDILKQERLLHLITILDEMTLMSVIEKNNLPLKHSDYEQFILSETENFLCLPEIKKENRFEFYFDKAQHIFHHHILEHVYNLIDCIEQKRQYISPEIEIFNNKFNLLPSSIEDTVDFPSLSIFHQIDDFSFMNSIDNHIIYALKYIFAKYNDFKGEITLFIDHVEQKIETSHTLNHNTVVIKTEDNALLFQHPQIEVRHEHTLKLDTMDKETIMEMLKIMWAKLHAAHGQFFVSLPDLPEYLAKADDIIFSYIVNTQKKSLIEIINKQSPNLLITEKNKRI